MAVGFQARIVAQISLQNVNNQLNPLSQTLTLGTLGNPGTGALNNFGTPAVIQAPCIGAATTEAAAVTAALTALGTAITATCAVPFANELIAQETAGG